jgi:hypothetical protein
MTTRTPEEIDEAARQWLEEERDAGRLPEVKPQLLAALGRIVSSSLPRRAKRAS